MELDDVAGHRFTCEVCGLTVMLTDHMAFQLGWDYPPFMGAWGVVTPRTCGNCGIEGTAWYALAVEKKRVEELTERQYQTVVSIVAETPAIEPT